MGACMGMPAKFGTAETLGTAEYGPGAETGLAILGTAEPGAGNPIGIAEAATGATATGTPAIIGAGVTFTGVDVGRGTEPGA